MFKEKKFLALIPARGGSKGLPKKNIKKLVDKPLIAWSIQAALNSNYIDDIIVTTDSEEIAKVSKEYGANVPFLRPGYLSTDEATTVDAVFHAIDFCNNELNKDYDYIVLLEPTSPLREKTDIDLMIEKLINEEDKVDSIISIGEAHEHPSIMKRITEQKTLIPYCESLVRTTRRQDNDKAYFPYGVAYIVKTSTFRTEKTFYSKRNTFYEIQRHQCYEIDDIYDFLAIENIIKYKGIKI